MRLPLETGNVRMPRGGEDEKKLNGHLFFTVLGYREDLKNCFLFRLGTFVPVLEGVLG